MLETFERERRKELNKEYLDLCKQKDRKGLLIAEVEDALAHGADIEAGGCKAMYLAVKNHNFSLINLLIRKGILKYPLAAGYIASMCEFGDFETYRKQFFEVIDKAMTITGFSLDYFVPFFNMALVHGDAEDAKTVADKYGVSYKQVADCVYERIIFEIIENDATDSLTFIESYRNWINEKVLGVAVSAGNLKVAEYILSKESSLVPPVSSVCDAVFNGYREVLKLFPVPLTPQVLRNASVSKDKGMTDYIKSLPR